MSSTHFTPYGKWFGVNYEIHNIMMPELNKRWHWCVSFDLISYPDTYSHCKKKIRTLTCIFNMYIYIYIYIYFFLIIIIIIIIFFFLTIYIYFFYYIFFFYYIYIFFYYIYIFFYYIYMCVCYTLYHQINIASYICTLP